MNGSKPQSNGTQNGLLHHQISPKRSKMVRNGQKLQKVGKKFQKFQKISINSKKFKNSISFEIFTHLSSKLPTRIPGASYPEIRHRLFQVTPHVLLFPIHAIFSVSMVNFIFQANLKYAFWPTWISRFFLRIGMAIRGKTSQNCVQTRLFCKQSRMRPHIRIFEVYND